MVVDGTVATTTGGAGLVVAGLDFDGGAAVVFGAVANVEVGRSLVGVRCDCGAVVVEPRSLAEFGDGVFVVAGFVKFGPAISDVGAVFEANATDPVIAMTVIAAIRTPIVRRLALLRSIPRTSAFLRRP